MSLSDPTPQFLVAAARRILANEGCFSFAQGHVSLRAGDRDTFWMTPWGYQEETLPSHVSRLTMDLRKLEGPMESSDAVEFHAAIYLARPDINAVIHTHSHWVQVLSTTDRFVDMYVGESGIVHGQQAYYAIDQHFRGENAQEVARALGDDKTILLMKNHGSVTTGTTIQEATVRTIMLEYCARVQIEAEAIGGQPFIPDPSYVAGFQKNVAPQIWDACYRRLRRTDPDLFEDPVSGPLEQT